jgi:hypothetical protein
MIDYTSDNDIVINQDDIQAYLRDYLRPTVLHSPEVSASLERVKTLLKLCQRLQSPTECNQAS